MGVFDCGVAGVDELGGNEEESGDFSGGHDRWSPAGQAPQGRVRMSREEGGEIRLEWAS